MPLFCRVFHSYLPGDPRGPARAAGPLVAPHVRGVVRVLLPMLGAGGRIVAHKTNEAYEIGKHDKNNSNAAME